MTGKSALAGVAMVLLVACGGGGGGASPASPSGGDSASPPPSGGSPPPADQTPPGDGEVPDGTEAPDDDAPVVASASILYPLAQASTAASTITVRGLASHNRGVAVVRVGGVVADTGLAALSVGSPSSVEFVAQVPLGGGRARLPITIEDDQGDTTDELDEVVVVLEAIPATFNYDAGRDRLIGLATDQRSTFFRTVLVDYDLIADDLKVLPLPTIAGLSGWCHFLNTDVSVFAMLESETETALFTIAPGELEAMRVGPITYDPGPGWVVPRITQLQCAADGQHVFASFQALAAEGDGVHTALLSVHMQSGAVSVLTVVDPDEVPLWRVDGMLLDGATLVTSSFSGGPLWAIDTATGTRSSLTPGKSLDPFSMVPDLERGRVFYVLGVDLYAVEVGDLGAITLISAVPRDHPLAFDQVRSMALDLAAGRLLIGDSGIDAIIAVDIETGERSLLRARTLGEGPRLRDPFQMVVADELGQLYVADRGGNAAPRLFQVDLISGARRQITTFDQDIAGLAFDEQARVAYVAHWQEVRAIDVKTGAQTLIAGAEVGSGVALGFVGDLHWDAERGRLLIADSEQGGVMALDPSTGLRSWVSKAGEAGDGPTLQGVNSMAFAGDQDHLFVSDQPGEFVARIDMATGDRSIFLTECTGSTDERFPGRNQALNQVSYDPVRDRLLVLGEGLFEVDPLTGNCGQMLNTAVPILQIAVTAKGQLLTSLQRAIAQLDVATLEHIVLSK